jgi:hypothetical protein
VKPVVLGRLARQEIKDAASFYEAHKPGLGSEFTDRVAEALEHVKLAPEGYQVIHGDLRRLIFVSFEIGRFGFEYWQTIAWSSHV